MSRENQIDPYVVMGNPIAHSQSPVIHRMFALQTEQKLDYQTLLVPMNEFVQSASDFFMHGGRGANVTLPFKQDALLFADHISERAELAGAVNTLIQEPNGRILGDNTDGVGLISDLLANGFQLQDRRVLLLGAGGAARGVVAPLLQASPAELWIGNRNLKKAEELVCDFSGLGMMKAMAFDALDVQPFDFIINATSASLQQTSPQISPTLIHSQTQVYDMVYGKGITSSNQWALSQGAAFAVDGLGMLVRQAAESFHLWRGIYPEISPVLAHLRQQMNAALT